jgi:two-component sensor histidine kinase
MHSNSHGNLPQKNARIFRALYYASFLVWLLLSFSVIAGPGESTKTVDERMDFARSTLELAHSQTDSSMLAEAFYLYGKAYRMAGVYSTSQHYFLRSLQIQIALKDTVKIARLYVRLCENERYQNHNEIAWRYATKALYLTRLIGNSELLKIGYNAIGQTHENLWQEDKLKNASSLDSALYYYKKIEYLVNKDNDKQGLAGIKLMLGNLYFKNDDRKCFIYLKDALKLLDGEKQFGVKTNIYTVIALAHIKNGNLKKGYQNLKLASQVFNDSKINEVPTLISLNEAYVTYFKEKGQSDSVIVYMDRLRDIRLAQAKADKENVLFWLQQENEVERQKMLVEQNKEMIDLQAKIMVLQRNMLVFLYVVVILAVIGVIVFFYLYQKNRRTSQLNEQLLKEQNHRIKNNLQSVSALLQLQSKVLTDPSARIAMNDSKLRVQAIALLQRKLYDEKLDSEVNLTTYLTELTHQVLAACGYSKVAKHINIEAISVSPDHALPIALILNELITNSCKYAFPDHSSPELEISCYCKDGRLHLTVADNGEGVSISQLENSRSFGIQLIKMQAEQLYAHYQFGKRSTGTGTVFKMEFTLRS